MALDHYACKRAYLSKTLAKFLDKNAKFSGISEFTDHVYKYKNIKKVDTDKDLFWCRYFHKNVWPTMKSKKFYPFHKANIKWKKGFQLFEMPVGNPYIECSSLAEAKSILPKNIVEWFSFKRTSLDYRFENIIICVENIDHVGVSVDILCKTPSNSLKKNMQIADDFMKKHKITKIIPHQAATLVRKKLRC